MKVFLVLFTVLIAVSCGKKSNSSHSNESGGTVLSDDQPTAKVSSASLDTQVVKANPEGASKGAEMSFPPGAVAVDVDVSIEEGDSLATDYVSETLGLGGDGNLSSGGSATVFSSNPPVDTVQPFTVSLEIPAAKAAELLSLTDNSEAIILYKKLVASENKYVLGVIPHAALEITGNKVSFETAHFGAFEIAYSTAPVTDAIEKETVIPIRSKTKPTLVNFELSEQSVAENVDTVTVTVLADQTVDGIITIPFVVSGSADADDHELISGVFQIPAGETTQTLMFKVTDDGTAEGAETVVLTLGSPHNAKTGEKTVHTITIEDND